MSEGLVSTGATTRSVDLVDGVRLEVLDTGDGERDERGICRESSRYHERDERGHHDKRDGRAVPLLLLHGFTGAAATWVPLLPALAVHRRVVAVSLHGHGASDAPPDPTRYAAARAATDLVAILDLMAIERVAVLGYSMGGRVALHLALELARTAPARLAALVLESASPGIADEADRAARRASDAALADDIERDGVAAFVERWERLPLWDSQSALSQHARERLRAQRLAGNARGLANSLRGLGTGATLPLHQRLHELRAPTLVICGAGDAKYTAIARDMIAALPHAQLSVVAHAGHAVHLEQPHAFARAVNDFLDGVAIVASL